MRHHLKEKLLPSLALASIVLFSYVLMALATPDVSIHASPRFGFSPLTTNIRLTIEPHELNRKACLVWDATNGLYGSSCWDLEGATAARTTMKQLKSLTPGLYNVTLLVERIDKVLLRDDVEVCSITVGEEKSC